MESIGIGLVIVSHSKHIAEGVVELISKVAKDVPITYVGGTEGGGIGTSFDQVDRVVSENPADTLLALWTWCLCYRGCRLLYGLSYVGQGRRHYLYA